jgi:hypothetical protein
MRRLPRTLLFAVFAFALTLSTAAFAYTTVSGDGTGQAQAMTLNAPGAGTAAEATSTSLSLSWVTSSGLPPGGGYLVLRSTSSGGPFEKVSSGSCQQATTLVSPAISCMDSGLSAGTTYFYEVEAAFYDIQTLWVSAPDAQFSGTTSAAPATSGAPAPSPWSNGAPAITSADVASFAVGIPSSFQVTASGIPAPAFSDTGFSGCTPSTLPSGVIFSASGLLSGTPTAGDLGTYAVCVNATNGIGPDSTQQLTLTITTPALIFTSPAVIGAESTSPNLGPIVVRRQTSSGTPITTGGALTVNLTASGSSGATFGTTQFASSSVTTVTIPNGESSATFWYGSTTGGSSVLTVAASGFTPGTQAATITTAPAGLSLALAGGHAGAGDSSGRVGATLSCSPPGTSDSCAVTGLGTTGGVAVVVGFENASGGPAVYSATQPSTIDETGPSTDTVTIGANTAASTPEVLNASVGTSTLTFGPYTLKLTVSP